LIFGMHFLELAMVDTSLGLWSAGSEALKTHDHHALKSPRTVLARAYAVKSLAKSYRSEGDECFPIPNFRAADTAPGTGWRIPWRQ